MRSSTEITVLYISQQKKDNLNRVILKFSITQVMILAPKPRCWVGCTRSPLKKGKISRQISRIDLFKKSLRFCYNVFLTFLTTFENFGRRPRDCLMMLSGLKICGDFPGRSHRRKGVWLPENVTWIGPQLDGILRYQPFVYLVLLSAL
jgi:hypothetical protein